MSLTEEERSAIISYRITKARQTLKEAKGIANLKYWNAVANRLYYSCYYITGALLQITTMPKPIVGLSTY